MNKPSQYEIDVCREVLEYCIAEMQQNEPHALNTINHFEDTLGNIPNEDELGDLD